MNIVQVEVFCQLFQFLLVRATANQEYGKPVAFLLKHRSRAEQKIDAFQPNELPDVQQHRVWFDIEFWRNAGGVLGLINRILNLHNSILRNSQAQQVFG